MSLRLLKSFEERESLPMKRYAIFDDRHGRQWWVTLTIRINREAENAGQQCIENSIFAEKSHIRRMEKLTKLFQRVVDFSQISYLDDTITRVLLRTTVEDGNVPSNMVRVPAALRHPLRSYMGISLDNLECLVGEDDASVIPYTSAELYYNRQPHLRFVQFKDVSGIGESDRKLHDGVYKVDIDNESFVYKEPTTPDDIKSQTNEIESLMLLSNVSYIIKLHGLVISDSPYLTQRGRASSPVVRALLLQYAQQGSLGKYLMSGAEISWPRRLYWAIQIASGLRDMHNANIPHIDLKSHNVVIDECDKALIIDLGRTGVTYGWNAPETYVDSDLSDLPLEVLQKADIYSFGVVLWEIATRKNVYIPMDMEHEKFFTMDGYSLPKGYQELVMECLHRNPSVRPTLAEIHASLQGFLADMKREQV